MSTTREVARPNNRIGTGGSRLTWDQMNQMQKDEEMVKKKIKCGVLFTACFDTLLSPAGIALTFWYPGISFASAISTLFTGALLLFISEKKVKTKGFRKLFTRLRLMTSFTSFMVSAFQSVWSVLLAIENETSYDVLLYVTIAAGCAYFVHFICMVISITTIVSAANAGTIPEVQVESNHLPNYGQVSSKTNTASTKGVGMERAPSALPNYEDLE